MRPPTRRRVPALLAVAVLSAMLSAVASPSPPLATADNQHPPTGTPLCSAFGANPGFGTHACYNTTTHYNIRSFFQRFVSAPASGVCDLQTGLCRQTATSSCERPSQTGTCATPSGWSGNNYTHSQARGPYTHPVSSSVTYGCSPSRHRSGSGCHAHPLTPPSTYTPYCGTWSPHNGTINPAAQPTRGGNPNPPTPAHNSVDLGPCGTNPPTTTRRPSSTTTTTVPGTLPEVTVSGQTVDEGDGAADFTITLSSAATSAVTVDVATSDGTATAGSDYASVNRTVTIPTSRTTAIVSVTVTDDTADEPDETFTLTLSNPSNANLAATSSATATIRDDDPAAPAVPTNVRFDCTVSGGVFTLDASWGPPTAGASGYSVQMSSNPVAWHPTGQLHSGSGPATSMTATAPSAGDYYAVIWPYGVPSVGYGVQVQVSTQCMAMPDVSVSAASDKREGLALVFQVSLSAASTADVTVEVAAVGVTATEGVDYRAKRSTVTVPTGSMSVDVWVFTISDNDVELDETLQLVLSSPSGATLGTSSTATGRILDNDEPAVSLPVTALTVTEGSSVQVTATLDQAPVSPGSVRFTASGAVGGTGSCATGDDYSITGTTFTFTATTSASITLTACGDTDTTDETVTLALTTTGISGLELGTPTTVDVTIDDTTSTLTPQQQCVALHGPGWTPVLRPDGTPWTDSNGQIICAMPH